LSPCESLGQEISGETLILCPRSLLKPIYCLFQLVHMMGMMRVLKTL